MPTLLHIAFKQVTKPFSFSTCTYFLNFQFLSGMSASFTTILIEHYEKTFKNSTDPFETNKEIVEAMLGTFQVKCFTSFIPHFYSGDICRISHLYLCPS